jgi:hypothetical protein
MMSFRRKTSGKAMEAMKKKCKAQKFLQRYANSTKFNTYRHGHLKQNANFRKQCQLQEI